MAICKWCNQDMLEADGCIKEDVKFPDSTQLLQIPYLQQPGMPRRCHDCNALDGHYHHPGCDMERCPRCRGQLISCGCLSEEEDGEI